MQQKFFFLVLGLIVCQGKAQADSPSLPGDGFAPSRYEVLWSKSPFAVASTEMSSDSLPYSLVGLAQVEGISYASLIDKRTQEHFLLATDKSMRGLTLVSITHGQDAASAYATIQQQGRLLTLKLDALSTTNPTMVELPIRRHPSPPPP